MPDPRFRPIYRRRQTFLTGARKYGRLGALGALLSADEISAYAQNAGFTGSDLQTAVAIALAESNPPGNPNSYNAETFAAGGTPPGQGSYGLWQIYLKKHPEFAGQNLMDPQTNANAAFDVYQRAGNSFRPWSTYGSGKYTAYLQPAAPPPPLTIDAATGQPIEDSTPTPGFPAVQAAGFFPGLPSGPTLGLTATVIGALLLREILSD